MQKKALVAGATGYLGQYHVKELKKRLLVRILIRKKSRKTCLIWLMNFSLVKLQIQPL